MPSNPSVADHAAKQRSFVLLCATALASYQIYFLPAAGTFFPIALFMAYACLPFIRIRVMDIRLLIICLLYISTAFISVVWSPNKGAWANGMVYGFLMFIAFFTARSFGDVKSLNTIIFWFLVFASINAVLVIIFRVSPSLKEVYLGSALQGLIKNPKLLTNSELFRPNVYDVDKSGGVYDNANTGAAFSLLCVGASMAIYGVKGRLIPAIFFVLFSLAVMFSGSKSALMIWVIAVSILGFSVIFRAKNPYWKVIAFCFGSLLSIAAIGLAIVVARSVESSDFGQEVSHTSEDRLALWRVARLTFPTHPLRGLGFGGWEDTLSGYAATGINVHLPPHNSLVMAWTESGLLAMLLLMVMWFVFARRLLSSIQTSPSAAGPVGALFALTCVSGMSMGDTFPFFGNQTMTVPMGVLLALGMFYHSDKKGSHARSDELVAG